MTDEDNSSSDEFSDSGFRLAAKEPKQRSAKDWKRQKSFIDVNHTGEQVVEKAVDVPKRILTKQQDEGEWQQQDVSIRGGSGFATHEAITSDVYAERMRKATEKDSDLLQMLVHMCIS